MSWQNDVDVMRYDLFISVCECINNVEHFDSNYGINYLDVDV